MAEWTVGFDQLKARVQEYPPERVAEITGVPAEEIVEAARTYATHGPACMPYGVAIDQLGLNGTRAEQCKIALRAITGNLGTLGGHLISRPGEPTNGGQFITEAELSLMHLLSMEQRRRQMGFDVCRLVTLNGWSLMEPHLQRVYGVPAPVTVQIQAHTTMLWRSILTGQAVSGEGAHRLGLQPAGLGRERQACLRGAQERQPGTARGAGALHDAFGATGGLCAAGSELAGEGSLH